jgi:3',5'-cyclic AMP phosphodiesterase CpdA
VRIRILSDLHLEFRHWTPPAVPVDVVVLAGDIHVGTAGVVWGRQHFGDCPIVYVPGNHEYYGGEMQSMLAQLRRVAGDHDVHLLDGDAVVINDVRFLGATLWTDFALYGSEPKIIDRAMAIATQAMVDYRLIRMRGSRMLRPSDTQTIHWQQVGWLTGQLAAPSALATVVVTHHLPHPLSVHVKYDGDGLNPSFASDLSALVREPVRLWIHGHTHESMDYAVNGTRVVCNPRGYLPHEPNAAFDGGLVVEVAV